MNWRCRAALSFTDVFELPVSVDMQTAASAFGMHVNTAYRLARSGSFPCAVLRIGHRYCIPTASLMRALGIEERPVYAEDLEAGAAFTARFD